MAASDDRATRIRELTIECFTQENSELRARLAATDDALVDALRDREGYRTSLRAALDLVADLSAQNDRLRQCVSRSLEDDYGVELEEPPSDSEAAA